MNTGAEAVETAIKAARKWGYEGEGRGRTVRQEIIVFTDNFHGRTTTIVGFSSEPSVPRGVRPVHAGLPMVPYGDLDALGRR
jgi:ornithine--oxo-acid transaminase